MTPSNGSTFNCASDGSIGLYCRDRMVGWLKERRRFSPWYRQGRGAVLFAGTAVFLHRLFVQSEGQSLAWETPSGLIDFHVDELWQRTHSKSFAAE
jgi:hypothetical protein